MSLFKWETLTVVSPWTLAYRNPVPGERCEIKLHGGESILVWRAQDRQSYFCHGLTFGGKSAPGGPISPFSGAPVETILRHYFDVVEQAKAAGGDILVWSDLPPWTTKHSAILVDLVIAAEGLLDYGATLLSKNGMMPEQQETLGELVDRYGESYSVYRRRGS